MTRAWARELGPLGITANAVAPGFIDTEMARGVPEKVLTALVQRTAAAAPGPPGGGRERLRLPRFRPRVLHQRRRGGSGRRPAPLRLPLLRRGPGRRRCSRSRLPPASPSRSSSTSRSSTAHQYHYFTNGLLLAQHPSPLPTCSAATSGALWNGEWTIAPLYHLFLGVMFWMFGPHLLPAAPRPVRAGRAGRGGGGRAGAARRGPAWRLGGRRLRLVVAGDRDDELDHDGEPPHRPLRGGARAHGGGGGSARRAAGRSRRGSCSDSPPWPAPSPPASCPIAAVWRWWVAGRGRAGVAAAPAHRPAGARS